MLDVARRAISTSTRFELTFAGRTRRDASNGSASSARCRRTSSPSLLRAHDVYLAASRDDPCSNALLEALACGLPAAFLRSGGHPELVGEGGIGFDDAGGAAGRARSGCATSSTSAARRSACPRSRTSPTATSKCCADDGASALRAPLALRRAYVPARTRPLAGRARGSSSSATTSAGRSTTTARGSTRTASRLGYEVAPAPGRASRGASPSSTTTTSERCSRAGSSSSHRLGLGYFHGRPGHARLSGVRRALRGAAAQRGADRPGAGDARRDARARARRRASMPANVSSASRSGSTSSAFRFGDDATARQRAEALGVPESAFVVGSFQKDGVGLGRRRSSRSWSKAPTSLVAVLERLRERVPELFVLLTGPGARLRPRRARAPAASRTGTCCSSSRDELARAYHALDVYLVTSRQEGGPKAVLESMARASRSSRPGSARRRSSSCDGENGLLADVDDVDALAAAVHAHPRRRRARAQRLRAPAARRPRRNADERLDPRWAAAARRLRRERRLVRVDPARGSARYARAGCRWSRLLLPEADARRAPRLLRARSSCPRPGEPVAGGTAKFQRLAPRLPERPRPTSRCSTSARRGCRATSARSCGSRGGVALRSSLNQDGVAYPGLGRRGRPTSSTSRYRRALRAADHVLYQSEF